MTMLKHHLENTVYQITPKDKAIFLYAGRNMQPCLDWLFANTSEIDVRKLSEAHDPSVRILTMKEAMRLSAYEHCLINFITDLFYECDDPLHFASLIPFIPLPVREPLIGKLCALQISPNDDYMDIVMAMNTMVVSLHPIISPIHLIEQTIIPILRDYQNETSGVHKIHMH